MSIRWKLILTVGLPLVLTYALLLWADYVRLRESAVSVTRERVGERAGVAADELGLRFAAVAQVTRATAASLGLELGGAGVGAGSPRPRAGAALRTARVRGLVAAGARLNPWIGATVVELDADDPARGGVVLVAGGARRGAAGVAEAGAGARRTVVSVYGDGVRPWSASASDARVAGVGRWSEPYEDAAVGGWAVAFVEPVVPAVETVDGSVVERDSADAVGVFVTVVPLDRVQALMDAAMQGGAPVSVLWSRGGRFLTHPSDASRVGELVGEAGDGGVSLGPDGVGVARVTDLRGMGLRTPREEPHWLAVGRVPGLGAALGVVVPESEALANVRRRLVERVLAGAAQLALIALLLVLLSVRLVRPIEQLNEAVQSVSKGKLDTRVAVTRRDEIGQLGHAFNDMGDRLDAYVGRLTEETAARESVESELRVAREIQESLLPRTFPPFPGRDEFTLYAVNEAAKRVAGDFYDFFFGADERLYVVIADVSGKGVPAALLMAVTRTLIRNHVAAGLSPADVVRRTSAALLADNTGAMFVTLILMRYDVETGALTYVNAGHPRPLLVRADGVAPFGEVTSPIVGVMEESVIGPVTSREGALGLGEALLLFTDGVTEARGEDGEMIGEEGLARLVGAYHETAVDRLCDRLVVDVATMQDMHLADDLTVVALRRER